jgi:predicted membrane metal-binding protein
MKSPLPALLPVFCLGIIAASRLQIIFPIVYYFALAVLALSLFFRNSRGFGIFMPCLAFLLGMALLVYYDKKAPDGIENYIFYKGSSQPYIVKGTVLNTALTPDGRRVFLFRAKEIQLNNLRHSCSGTLLVRSAPALGLKYGQELILCGNVYRSRFQPQGADAMMSIKAARQIIILPRGKIIGLKPVALYLKEKSEQLIYQYVKAPAAAIIDAMVLGEKRNIPYVIYDSMVKTGTVHILPRLYTKMPSVAL